METNQGFTFTRKAPNKAVNVEFMKIKTTEKIKQMEDVGFSFKKVGENPLAPPLIANKKSKDAANRKLAKNLETNEDSAKSKGKNVEKLTKTKTLCVLKKNIGKKGIFENKKEFEDAQVNQSVLEFNVVKKRRTIKLDQDIDLSSNSILVSPPKAECMSGEIVKMNMPVIAEKVKSNEIFKLVISNNINDLIKECIIFLKDESKYSREVVKHCNANYFSDIDYRKEIEVVNCKMEVVKGEIAKWNKIFENEKNESIILVPEIKSNEISSEIDIESIQKEFEEKAKVLQQQNERLRYFFENAKEKAENLLKNVFGSMEEKNVDALFLLKAMSKLGR